MSNETYVPKHRTAPISKHRAAGATKSFRVPSIRTPQLRKPDVRLPAVVAGIPAALAKPHARRIVVASGIAMAATGVAVTTGVAGSTVGSVQLTSASAASAGGTAAVTDFLNYRAPAVTRSLDRLALANTAKAAALSGATGSSVTQSADLTPKPVAIRVIPATSPVSSGDPKAITIALMPSFGMNPSDFSCVDRIWTQESGWNLHAANSSGAYGIPQALPGSKMASAGPDWQNNATTQIKWGLGYIHSRYGSPCNALSFKLSHGWY